MAKLSWEQFSRDRQPFMERAEVLRAINEALRSKGWGSIDQDGKVTAFKQESESMIGSSAAEFFEHSEALGYLKYDYIVDKVKQLAEGHQMNRLLVADLGCGPGILTTRLKTLIPSAEVVGVDLSPDMIAGAQARATKKGLADGVKFVQMDARSTADYFQQEEGQKPDIVVSRNMLHRVGNIQDMLASFIETAKNDGGLVYSVSFYNPENFDLRGLNLFLKGIKGRESLPGLQESWTLAYLNAPRLAQYEEAVKNLAGQAKIKSTSVKLDLLNYVNILIEKAKAD